MVKVIHTSVNENIGPINETAVCSQQNYVFQTLSVRSCIFCLLYGAKHIKHLLLLSGNLNELRRVCAVCKIHTLLKLWRRVASLSVLSVFSS